MIIVRIKGGLGNQLFQYAAGYTLSKRLNQKLIFNTAFTSNMTARGYKLPALNVDVAQTIEENKLPFKVKAIKNKYVNKLMRTIHCDKHKWSNGTYWIETRETYLPGFFTIDKENIYLDGYFQTPKYFEQHRSELLAQIKPNYDPEEQYLKALDDINNCCSVAVHVRRSDFKKDNNKFHYILDKDYYRKAISYIREHVKNPVFFWFSDDMDWVHINIGESEDFRFISIRTSHADIDDMMLMKNCKHIITANSTFSWWASWLNEHVDAIHIVPKKPYGNDNMIPSDWVKM